MTPEELAAYREWVRIMEFKRNSWPCMALDHIDQQAARIAELEKDLEATEKRVREHEEHENQTHEILGKILGTDNTLENVARRAISKITELEKKNAVLEAQVTTLKKIAISERSRCIRTESYDHCEGMYRIDLPEAIESSRRQLAEEHPEAF